MADLPPIPEDHPIQEIWKLNRLDTNGLIELARNGDVDAAKTLMVRYVELLRREQRAAARGVKYIDKRFIEYKNQLTEYIISALNLSLETGDANKGFNLAKPKSRPKLTYLEKQEQCDLAFQVSKYVEELSSLNKAYEVAELELGVKKRTIRQAYEKYMRLSLAKK